MGTVTEIRPTPARRVRRPAAEPWGVLEFFVLVLYLSSSLLFFPGAQAVRMPIRALPYVGSLLMLLFFSLGRTSGANSQWVGKSWLAVALGVLVLQLCHPETNPFAGLAQVVMQFSIAAPAFWMAAHPIGSRRMDRLLTLVFLANAASALVGLLQVFYPDHFMPPEFSRDAISMKVSIVEELSYTGAMGKNIIRPPGLTDLPGGAATSAATTALIGLLFGLRPRLRLLWRITLLTLAVLGLATLYLTQVRSLLLMTVAGYATMCLLLFRQGRLTEATRLAAASGVAVIGCFLFAVTFGGDAVYDRFFGIVETGLATSYQSNRGIFLEHTLDVLLYEYPLGAGLGRWGMMAVHFGQYDNNPSLPIWVEIQLTGWLIDGGIPEILCYSAAIGTTLWRTFQLSDPARGGELASTAGLIFCVGLFALGQSFAGPAFNTTIGMQFWFLSAVLMAAAGRVTRRTAPSAIEGRRVVHV